VVKFLRAENYPLKRAFLHLADVLLDEIRVWDIPPILNDFLYRTLLGKQVRRKRQKKSD
jgi:hypothetical protein